MRATRASEPRPRRRGLDDAHNTTMLLPVVAAVLSDALEIDRVLSARSSFDVLDVSADSAEVRSCAHRMLMRSVHPDHHCRSPHAAVCEAAHRTSLLVNDARDQLLAKTTKSQRAARKPRTVRKHQEPWEEPPASAVRVLALLCLTAIAELVRRAASTERCAGSSGRRACQLQGCVSCGCRATLGRRALAPWSSLPAALVHAPGSCARLRSCGALLRPPRTWRGVCGALAVHVPCGLSAGLGSLSGQVTSPIPPLATSCLSIQLGWAA